jgi:NAD(P)-dependent dehydrogenase (short-subunit alcohol dehydrogenase family)
MLGYRNAHPEVPLRRWGDPVKDAGGLAVFLASSDADYLTGMTFQLDGGGSMHA